jgi:hypothetical protein
MAITNPDANTIRLTNESGADFQDIVDSGVAGITKTGTATYVITRALSLVNSTLSDTNKIIRFEWGAINTPLLIDDDSELQLGELDGDGYGINGCQVFMNSSYSSNTINLGGVPTGDNTGNIKFYGCHIKGTSPNTTGTGINGTYFWRLYDDSTAQVNDIRDCQIEFNGGGRFHGTNSKLVRNKFINCKTAVSPFTTRNPFGEISDNQVFACSASYYWYPLQSGSMTVTNAFGRDNDYAAIVSSVGSDTNQTLTFVDADFDTFTFRWISAPSSAGANLRVREDYNYVPTILNQATQNPITSGRVYIENLAGTQVHNEALDGNGQVGELILRAGQYRKATGSTRTDETPHTVKVRCYGYLFQEFPVTIDARTVTNLSQIINNFVVANESTAGAYTGITVSGSTETITISADHTMQEIYDYVQWWSAQSTNLQYVVPMESFDGNTFIIAEDWRLICNGGSITSGTGKILAFSGTGYLQLDGETADNIVVNSGDVYLESATDLTGMTIADDLRIDTGANSALDFVNMIVGGDVWNDAASNTLTIIGFGGSLTAGDPGTGNGQTNILLGAQVTLTGLQANSEVRAYVGTNPATATEIDGVENSGTSFSFTQTEAGNAGYIQIHNIQYESITLDLTYGSTDQSIPIQQRFDRNYNNPT